MDAPKGCVAGIQSKGRADREGLKLLQSLHGLGLSPQSTPRHGPSIEYLWCIQHRSPAAAELIEVSLRGRSHTAHKANREDCFGLE